ncbi:Tetratricopeptide-like helical domain superfamily [Arabidopsis thaliana x Arabidopsis arenosa]|uniref:Tetratricopeptide-like helical domain superfamily n=1 Tax=Arabidopsis thaliana x Arabidopsis arenosa TaxID=1240361 RepID=A0A8T2BYL7_9BRAS|nr:Tetratricopeptide-like helical domain superfamily [Arabidopsis thaliana x Arabidopsis arenosa]
MADKYNVEEAEALAKRALHLPIAQATPIYEQLLSLYPTSARYWKQYVEAHMAVNNDDATKQIFSRCLLTCLQVPLWQCYIRFIRKVYDKKGAEGQEETTKAFEFMLNYIGTDIASGPIWTEYITFLKSLPALNLNEDLHRKTALRKVYHRAILTPTHHVEQLWKDYENFENSVNRQLAKGLVNEYQPKFNSARAVYRERKKYIEEIDWNMLAVPPTGSSKEETQWVAWKKFLSFEKGNPQRIDTASSTKRIIYAYEQCLMCLYHYPDVWYDYAEWHVKSGTTDAAIKVFQRALKAIPDSEMLKYAYAEMEESRGAIQSAKKLYESILGVSTNSLAHIQFLRFLRRAEGVEAARKYFLDARKSPSCTYHVYIAFATMAFCIDKEPKVAHNIFEEGLKLYMSEPVYILEYADFLTRLNDDRNIRALFERALSTLPAEDSAEVWKRFIQFEQTYGDLASILKVEQRMKEALSGKGEEGSSPLESSLQDVVSRYSYMDLWPCTSNDLDHLARQELLVKNLNKKVGKTNLPHGPVAIGSVASSSKVVYPDTSQMVVQDPTKKSEFASSANPVAASASNTFPSIVTATATHGSASTFDEIPKTTPPALLAFLANLPIVDGPTPNVDVVLSICLQSDFPTGQIVKQSFAAKGNPPSQNDPSGPTRGVSQRLPRDRRATKRKDSDRQEEDDTATVQSQPLPTDVFRLRQMRKARGIATSSQTPTGSTSYGSAFSGELSGSTG